ncbi:MAG: DNA primase [Pseudomonadota bacterium]|nr:DNA primase [Pseudomonadota bacterium]
MKYPKDYLNEIKLRLKVSQVVGKTVQLKKRGKEFIGLSPFKNEKTPSFTVNDEKEFYHCFSTGEHGNIFDFLMKTKSVGFGEAVKTLAAQAGMQPYRFSNFDKKKELRFQTYKNIFKDYTKHFNEKLFHPSNSEAIDYLIKRGLKKEIIEEFKLGYVPWKNSFYEELLKKYSEEDINLTGLYYKSDKNGKFIDRFNSRIIFPVNNISGETIAFGGRVIRDGKLAKYINSPETEFYKKGNMVFNLDKAKDLRSETEDALVVEGYMDVVSVYASGIKNVISNSGTALTEIQIKLIWKFFSNPIICLDGDESGQNAAIRIAERLFPLINEKNKIYFSVMPDGKDPDDYIKQNGKEGLINLLKEKEVIQSFIWNYHQSKINKNNPYEISKFEKEIKKLSYTIKDETLKKYDLEDFLEKIKNLTPNQSLRKNSNFFNFKKKKDFKVLNETKILHQKRKGLTKIQIIEFSILFMFVNYKEITSRRAEEISNLEFLDEENERLKNLFIDFLHKGNDKVLLNLQTNKDYKKIIEEIKENSNIRIITKNKKEQEIMNLLDELIQDHKDQNSLKKIESLEQKLINNLDENSYSELIKLKSQLNGE